MNNKNKNKVNLENVLLTKDKPTKKDIHDYLCKKVFLRLYSIHNSDDNLERISMFKEYNFNGLKGEIDVYSTFYNGYALKFEIKSSDKYKRKAYEQLKRSNSLFNDYRVFNFYVYYKNNELNYKWVK